MSTRPDETQKPDIAEVQDDSSQETVESAVGAKMSECLRTGVEAVTADLEKRISDLLGQAVSLQKRAAEAQKSAAEAQREAARIESIITDLRTNATAIGDRKNPAEIVERVPDLLWLEQVNLLRNRSISEGVLQAARMALKSTDPSVRKWASDFLEYA